MPAHRARRRRGVVVHRRGAIASDDVTRCHGIPVTSAICTLIDITACLDRGQLQAAINEADRLDLVDPEALRSALDRVGRRPGTGTLRQLLDRRTFTLTDSELERRFLTLARAAGLSGPVTGSYLNGFKVDFYWPELGLVVETDGLRYHRTPAQQAKDHMRDQAHAAVGLTPLRFTHAQGPVRCEPRAGDARRGRAEADGHAVASRRMSPRQTAWVASAAREVALRAERELEALVGVSSPSGDAAGAEEALSIVTALLPTEAHVERPQCSSPDHAADLLARINGSGDRRVLLLGHIDTVVRHQEHKPLEHRDRRLIGSGTVDMKGGVVLALGVLRALATHPDSFAQIDLLLVTDEEWRTSEFAHAERFAGYDACLCFEAGERGPGGEEGVVVRRKAAATLLVQATGVSAHSGSAPDRGRNALLALAVAAERVAREHDPAGQERLTAVPTILRSGDAFNVVPSSGELHCDLRADRLAAFDPVIAAIPDSVGGATLEAKLVRRWPGMDTRSATDPVLRDAARLLGRPVVGVERGGASDASHLAAQIPVTIDGLGPRGGGAHTPDEFVLAESLHSRAEVALAVAASLLDLD